MKHTTLASTLLLATLFVGAEIANAQPGATPPGQVPPYSAPADGPPPNAGPPPAPYQPGPPPTAYDQGYYGQQGYQPPMPPPRPRSQERTGWNFGLSGGVGSMQTDADGGFACQGCEVDPPTGAFDLHVGNMLFNRFALQAEFWYQTRNTDANGDSSVQQSMLLIAAQFWVAPRIWIKGGFGFSSLSQTYFDGFEDQTVDLGSGGGLMAAAGYELIHSRGFGLDAQLKVGTASYEMDFGETEEVSIGTVALGINWY